MAENRLLVNGIPPVPLDREFTVVGKSLNRMDAVEKVKGKAKYSGDMKIAGILYGKILRCPHLRARIRRIDTSRAEKLPGIKAILTKENTKGWLTHWYNVPQLAFPETITYEGQEVAVVAAEDILIVQEALKQIEIEYEVLPPMIEAEDTYHQPHPPLIGDEEYPLSENIDRRSFVIRGET